MGFGTQVSGGFVRARSSGRYSWLETWGLPSKIKLHGLSVGS